MNIEYKKGYADALNIILKAVRDDPTISGARISFIINKIFSNEKIQNKGEHAK